MAKLSHVIPTLNARCQCDRCDQLPRTEWRKPYPENADRLIPYRVPGSANNTSISRIGYFT